MKVTEEREKTGLKFNFQKTKIMASGPITSWQVWGKVETVADLIFGLQNHYHSDCGHGIKRCLLLGRKALTNLDSVLQSRDVTLPTKVHIVKVMFLCFSSHVGM